MDTIEQAAPEFRTAQHWRAFVHEHQVIGPAGCFDPLCRILARVPFDHAMSLIAFTRIVVVTATGAEYLSQAAAVGHSVLVLAEGVFALPEDEQAAIILPQVARCVLHAKHLMDPTLPADVDLSGCFDAETGKLVRHEQYNAAMRRINDAEFDLGIETFTDKQKAAKLARLWQEQYEQCV